MIDQNFLPGSSIVENKVHHIERRIKRVEFNQLLRVILIPCRGEYKKAGLYGELWWANVDFLQFQAAANCEIRMLASYEGIGAKAARFRLYQPGSHNIDPDEFLAFVGNASDSCSSKASTPSASPFSSAQDLIALAEASSDLQPFDPQANPPKWRSENSAACSPRNTLLCPGLGSPRKLSSLPQNSPTPSTLVSASAQSPSSSSACMVSTTSPARDDEEPMAIEGVTPTPHSDTAPAAVSMRPDDPTDEMFGQFDIEENEVETDQQSIGYRCGPESDDAEHVYGSEMEIDQPLCNTHSNPSRSKMTTQSSTPTSPVTTYEGGLQHKRKSQKISSSSPESSSTSPSESSSGLSRVSSLDCVKSALRVPLPDGDDEDSEWTWDGKLKSSSQRGLHHRNSMTDVSKDNAATSEIASSSSGSDNSDFWRLCVSLEKPDGLDGERKRRFQSRYSYDKEEPGVGIITLVGWIGAFFVVAYLVLDRGSAAIDMAAPSRNF